MVLDGNGPITEGGVSTHSHGDDNGPAPIPVPRNRSLVMRRFVGLLAVGLLAGCTPPPPKVVVENPPHYVVVQDMQGPTEVESQMRLEVDATGSDACRNFGRRAELPAQKIECLVRHHIFWQVCVIWQYTYRCLLGESE